MRLFRRSDEPRNARSAAPARLWARLSRSKGDDAASLPPAPASAEVDVEASEPAEATEPWVLWPRVAQALVATLALGLLLAVADAYHVWSTRTRQFKVQHFAISGQLRATEAEIVRASGLREGSPLIGEEPFQVARRIEALPWVASAQVTVRLPATLQINVVEHQPAGLLVDGELWVVDAEARVIKAFSPGDVRDVPLLSGVAAADLMAKVGDAPVTSLAEERARAEVETRRILARSRLQALLRLGERVADSALADCFGVGELHWDAVTGASLIAAADGAELRLGFASDDDLDAVLDRAGRLCRHAQARGERIRYALLDDPTHPERVVVATGNATHVAAGGPASETPPAAAAAAAAP